jgi:hypothetical protein
MYKIFILAVGLAAITTNVQAQKTESKVKKGVKKGAQEVKEAGVETGDKVAEVSSKAYHKVKDETYNNKKGPDGQTIYISGEDKYYYIDKKGHKVYVTKDQIHDKK